MGPLGEARKHLLGRSLCSASILRAGKYPAPLLQEAAEGGAWPAHAAGGAQRWPHTGRASAPRPGCHAHAGAQRGREELCCKGDCGAAKSESPARQEGAHEPTCTVVEEHCCFWQCGSRGRARRPQQRCAPLACKVLPAGQRGLQVLPHLLLPLLLGRTGRGLRHGHDVCVRAPDGD